MSVLTFKSDEYKTFPQILKEYASNTYAIKGNNEKTVCEYLLDLRTFFRYHLLLKSGKSFEYCDLKNVSISSLTVEDVKSVTSYEIVDFLMFVGIDKKNSSSTRQRKLSALRSFFKFAYVKRHYIDSNPTSDVDSPKKGKHLPSFLTLEEAVRLLETVKNDVSSKTVIRDYAIICLFLNTGMRLSELVGLSLKSFDPEVRNVKVLGKGNKERILYLNDASRNAVKNYLKIRLDPKYIRTNDTALFLSGRQTRISAKTVQWMVYKYLDMAGLGSKGLSVHKLRHTAATLMFQSGKVDIRVIKEILGHEQLNTTQIYTHVVDKNISDAMDNNPLAEIEIKRKVKTYGDEND